MAAIVGMKLDPRGAGDVITVIVISCVYFITFLGAILLLWQRKYPPIKSKNPFLMAGFFASSVLWFAGDIQANGHAPLKGTPMVHCKAFGVWVRALLGACAASALIALRSYGLFRVFCKNLPYRGLGFYLPFLVYCVCIAVYGIVSQVLSSSITIMYLEAGDICYYSSGFKASLLALLWVTWVLVALTNWKIRHIKSSFNESREMIISCLVVFGILTFTTVLHYAKPKYPLDLKWRIATTALDHVATNTVFWTVVGVPLYKCVTDKKRYLEQWKWKLRQDGLHREYEVEHATGNGTLLSSSGATRPLSYLYQPKRASYVKGRGEGQFFYSNSNGSTVDASSEEKQTTLMLDSRLMSHGPDSDSPLYRTNRNHDNALHLVGVPMAAATVASAPHSPVGGAEYAGPLMSAPPLTHESALMYADSHVHAQDDDPFQRRIL